MRKMDLNKFFDRIIEKHQSSLRHISNTERSIEQLYKVRADGRIPEKVRKLIGEQIKELRAYINTYEDDIRASLIREFGDFLFHGVKKHWNGGENSAIE